MGEKDKSREELNVLSLFQTLTDIIAINDDVYEAMKSALKEICEITGLTFGQIWQPSSDEHYLECTPAWYSLLGQHQAFRKASAILRLNPGEDLPGSVFLSHQPRWLSNLAEEKNFPRLPIALQEELKSGFAVPLIVNNKVLAVVEFFVSEPKPEDKDLISLISGYAAQLGLLLQRNQSEAALRRQEKEYRILFENNPTPMLVCHEENMGILAANEAAVTHLGYSLDEFRAMNFQDLQIQEGKNEPQQENMLQLKGRELLKIKKKNNAELLIEVTGKEISFLGKKARVYLLNDVTERHKAEEIIRYQAYHDSLTGLPNRLLFNDRLEMSLAQAHRSQNMLALLFIDLDRFKNINDTLGHSVGDRLIQHVAGRLKMHLREQDTIARFGGDEFMILLPKVGQVRDAAKVAQKILNIFKEPWLIDEHELYVTSSIGVALYPFDGEDIQTLVRNADTAMYRAKAGGRNAYQLYTPAMNMKAFEHLMLENRLRYALEHEEFLLHYQPQVELKNGKVIGMEALVRWQHPGLGLLGPKKFIFLAEETGLIVPLGEWVLRAACRQNKEWQQEGLPKLLISVNLAPRQFQQRNLVKMVKSVLSETGLESRYLGLEVTETVAMENVDMTIQILRLFNKMGIELSIDDFGTGYSSLSYLKRFPIHRLKIDQAFIRDLNTDANDAAIAASVIILARNMKIKAMAEGVETSAQLEFLKVKECDEAQGYLFSKPLPSSQFAEFIRNSNGSEHGSPHKAPAP